MTLFLIKSFPDSIAIMIVRHPALFNLSNCSSLAVFERAVETHDGLRYDEPEPLNFSARHWLGDALLEAGRFADAERVYQGALDQHPDNGWSHFGLEKALRAQGKTAQANAALEDFNRVWSRADVIIDRSIF